MPTTEIVSQRARGDRCTKRRAARIPSTELSSASLPTGNQRLRSRLAHWTSSAAPSSATAQVTIRLSVGATRLRNTLMAPPRMPPTLPLTTRYGKTRLLDRVSK